VHASMILRIFSCHHLRIPLAKVFAAGGEAVSNWHGRKVVRKDHEHARGCLEFDVTLPDEKLSCAHASPNSAY